MTSTFPAEVIDAVVRHMNDDHADDSLLICRTLGSQPGATAARMTGLGVASFQFVAVVDGVEVEVEVPAEPLTERAQIRTEVVRLYQEACVAAGVEPRAAAEHPPANQPTTNQEPS